MTLDWSLLINGLRDLGVVVAFISGFILFYRFIRERPILKYTFDCSHKYTEKFNHSIISLNIRIDIAPHNSSRSHVNMKFENVLIKEKEIQIELELVHTHGNKILSAVSKLTEWDFKHLS